MNRRHFLSCLLSGSASAAGVNTISQKDPSSYSNRAYYPAQRVSIPMASQTEIHAGDIRAIVDTGDNAGWCGLRHWSHTGYSEQWLLSPAFTLEHYIGIPSDAPEYIQYEPCYSPRSLQDISPNGCTLHYAPLSCSQIECDISYHMKPPHYADIDITMQTTRTDWPFDYVALFFATIVKAPIYTGINIIGHDLGQEVKGDNPWVYFNGHALRSGRTIHPDGIEHPELPRPSDPPDTYYYDDASVRFDRPFFYAHVGPMVFATLFHAADKENIRFVVNPVAPAFGGPAWDFFWIIRNPQPDQTQDLSLRSLFKPFVTADDILQEYAQFE